MITNIADLPLCRDPLQDLLKDVSRLKRRILSEILKEVADLPLDGTSGEHLSSVMNLMNYVIMRREDLRALQERLTTAGLSSLGRGESNVLANINRGIDMLSRAVLHEPGANKKGTDTFSRQTQKGTALKCIRPH